jgi:prophage antirepressor-like protein
VLRSRKPEARKFAKWVTGEVLPSIRKTGGYVLDGKATVPSLSDKTNRVPLKDAASPE